MQKSAQIVIPAKAVIQVQQQVTIWWIPGSSPRMTLAVSLEGRYDAKLTVVERRNSSRNYLRYKDLLITLLPL
ncbi:MAG: hypothetical protein P9L92_17940 [Candidatus Electryonea clarkiae]|nr:hypothetical protein [Candidatus Electryonea clarkiae]MDP8289074.1 hypothetical protein [Candidatus Electryonea clarkiae]